MFRRLVLPALLAVAVAALPAPLFELDAASQVGVTPTDKINGYTFTDLPVTVTDGIPSWELATTGGAIDSSDISAIVYGNQYTTVYRVKFIEHTTWRTLLRGTPHDHEVIVEAGTNLLGMFCNSDGAFRSSGYVVPMNQWMWLIVTGESSGGKIGTSTFYTIQNNQVVTLGTADRVVTGNAQERLGYPGQDPGFIANVKHYGSVLTKDEIYQATEQPAVFELDGAATPYGTPTDVVNGWTFSGLNATLTDGIPSWELATTGGAIDSSAAAARVYPNQYTTIYRVKFIEHVTWRTLLRGDSDHEVIVEAGTNHLGMFSNRNGGFRSSGYVVPMYQWMWLIVTGEASDDSNTVGTSTFYTIQNNQAVTLGTADRVVSGTRMRALGHPGQDPGFVANVQCYDRIISATEMVEAASSSVTLAEESDIAGTYSVSYLGQLRETVLTVSCDGVVAHTGFNTETPVLLESDAEGIATYCSSSPLTTHYTKGFYGPDKFECLWQVSEDGVSGWDGHHYLDLGQYWGTVSYRKTAGKTCTDAPTADPTNAPSAAPSVAPTNAPSAAPSVAPSAAPSVAPSAAPSVAPSAAPTATPTQFSVDVEMRVMLTLPTDAPTADPTAAPTNAPTGAPTVVPTDAPTVVPTDAPTAAPTAAPTYAVGLNAGDVLGPGDRIVSPNGLHALVMQSDGNLVLYKDGTVVWATSLYGVSLSAGSSAALQGDGNFVLYAPGMQALWAFHSTSPNAGVGSSPAGTYIRLQDDGNLVAYGPDGATVWHTKTYDMQPSYEWDFRGCTGDVDSHGIVAMLKDGASCSSEGLVLDGTSGYVHVEPYLFGGLISIETKFRFDSLSGRSWMRIFDWGSGSHQNNIYFAQHYNTNNLVVQYHETASTGQQWGAIVDGFTITPGEWITARLAAGPEGIKVYINGVKIVDAAGDYSSPYVTRTQQYIGKSNWPDSLFVGTIAYMKVWHGTVDFEEQIYTWDFRNCAGDVWSHGLTARLQNGATCNADGVEFDGVDDFVDVDDFSFGDGISIEVKYVYHSTSSWMRIFDFGSGQHANNLYFGQHAGSQNTILTYHEKVHDGVTAGHQMSEVMSGGLEGWNTVRMSIGRNGLKIWRNDVQVVDKSGDYSLPTATRTNQYIGKSNWPDPSFHGKIAYMKIWKNSDNFGGPVSRRRRNLLALAEGAQRHLLSVPADSDVLPALADSLKVDAADISITSITEVNTGLYEVLFAVTVRADTAEELETMRTQVRETVYSEDFEVAGFYSVLSTEAPTAAPTPEPTDMPTFNFVAPEAASLSSGYVLSDDEHAMAGSPGQGHLFVLAIDADHTLYRCPKDQNMKFCYACADPSRNAFAKTNRPASITQWFEQDGFTGEAHDGTWSVDADSVLHWVGADQTDYSFQITTKEVRRL